MPTSFIDLHCHWVAGIDDGARSHAEGRAMLLRLGEIGFSRVIATPHMRPGLFDNQRAELQAAYQRALEALSGEPGLPELGLSCEHYFDDVVYGRLLSGEGLPYPGERAVLLEFYDQELPLTLTRQLFELSRRGLRAVIAHPERYRRIWEDPDTLERLVDAGAVALLDVAALAGKYGRAPRESAEQLLERGLYQAACSDAHRPADVDEVARGIELVRARYGDDEVTFLLREGPLQILEGRVEA